MGKQCFVKKNNKTFKFLKINNKVDQRKSNKLSLQAQFIFK